MGSTPDTPQLPPSPTPANTVIFDDNGNIAGQYNYDASSNTYSYKPRILTPDEQTQKAQLTGYKQSLIEGIASTPEADTLEAQREAKAYADSVGRGVNEGFRSYTRGINESLSGRGLAGSKAYADTLAQLGQKQLQANMDIQNQATAMGENLLTSRKNNRINALNSVLGLEGSGDARAANTLSAALGSGNSINSTLGSNYSNEVSALLSRYNAQIGAEQVRNQIPTAIAGAGGYALGTYLGGTRGEV